jgi:hypothetical protein
MHAGVLFGRLIDAAKGGLEAMQTKCAELGIPREQIMRIREAMLKVYDKIPLMRFHPRPSIAAPNRCVAIRS